MGEISTVMARDHKHCDERFAAAERAAGRGDWVMAAREFGAFAARMSRHFEMEEGTLFPAFESRTGMTGGPTQVMRAEHAQMRAILAAMTAAVAARDADELLGQAETLNVLMQQHNIKEEQVLYPMMDQTLADEAASLVGAFKPLAAT